MAKAKKITKEQLKTVNENQDKLIKLVNQIGMIETQKHSLLHAVADVNKTVEEFKVELEKEYGSITIDLKTGEYTEAEDKDKLKVTK
jgi:hypothetical protein|tara:strand:+ start:186 stop:446 length:261 start_codon:yes stop_codon:yes gene_type:complete